VAKSIPKPESNTKVSSKSKPRSKSRTSETKQEKTTEPKSMTHTASTKISENMQHLYDATDAGYTFPNWVLDPQYLHHIVKQMKHCEIYYHKSPYATSAMIKRLAVEREPVNIETRQHFSKKKLKAYFGFDTAYYTRFFKESNYLAPNIAIYTPILVRRPSKPDVDVHLLSVIGLAFDDKKQVDYQYYFAPNRILELKNLAFNHYKRVFELIWACAHRRGLTKVILCLFGMGFFAKLYPGDMFTEVYVPAFKASLSKSKHVEIAFMGMDKAQQKQLGSYADIGYWPDNLNKVNLGTTLFVNAWDCASVIGNGHEMDNSIDGRIGRVSSVAVTGCGLTNPFLMNHLVAI
jgi:hypothetical protein